MGTFDVCIVTAVKIVMILLAQLAIGNWQRRIQSIFPTSNGTNEHKVSLLRDNSPDKVKIVHYPYRDMLLMETADASRLHLT